MDFAGAKQRLAVRKFGFFEPSSHRRQLGTQFDRRKITSSRHMCLAISITHTDQSITKSNRRIRSQFSLARIVPMTRLGFRFPALVSSVHAHVSNFRAVHYQTFRSGRLKMGPEGKKFFALTPAGGHAFDTKTPTQDETKAGKRKPKRVIGTIRANEN